MNEIDTTDPRADYPPDRMFVNQGTDRRIPGALGTQLALIQRLQSFKSAEPPQIRVEQWAGGALFETQTWPNGRQHVAIAIPYSGRWATIRFGWRWDRFWGDENVRGYNPHPQIVGGAILDCVVKLRAREPFISTE